MEFNNIYSGLISGKEKLALVGLGYVGMPIAVEFAKHVRVIGFDINEKRVNEYRSGIDATNEVGEAIKKTTVDFTADPSRLKEAKFIIVAYLHDIVEDTKIDISTVKNLFGKEIADAVDAMTKRKNESRKEYITRCAANKIARFVKLQDAVFNASNCFITN